MKTPKERDNKDLLELVCQLHNRALRFPTKEMHDAYLEARAELETRFVSQPPASKLWEEVDAVKEPPEESGWYKTICNDSLCRDLFYSSLDNKWMSEENGNEVLYSFAPSSYLRPVTGQRYSEAIEIVKELAEWSEKYPRQTVYPVSADIDGKLIAIEEKAKQFIQSLNKK